ncbi:hypothetical protein LCGC14_0947460 [marine sediment metagenome]|uniref:PD-(D/E)XK endonuclease-like domain-containing protein n=1 Tax=marine sediment metagenome TaxID=412755 RepID=A0A0F9R1Y5_9ZZZZ
MKRVDNPELKRLVLNHLADQYNIKEVREPNHLSSYVYCRTRTFLDQKQTTEPTDEEVMLFAIGYGLQDVLTPKDAIAPVYEQDGIIYRPDMSFNPAASEVEQLVELKTTRKSAKNHFMDEYLPLTWLDYMMGGCYIRGTQQYDLIILYLMGNYAPPFPQLYCDTFYFDKLELEENWKKIVEHKQVLEEALASDQPPTPFQHCYEWECKYCRYNLVCQTIASATGVDNKQLEEDRKLWD